MKAPEEEQALVDHLARVPVLVLDDFGIGTETAYFRQVLQEIIDARAAHERGGLVVTSNYSLNGIAAKSGHDAIPSRLAAMCEVIEITGIDRRLAHNFHKTSDLKCV